MDGSTLSDASVSGCTVAPSPWRTRTSPSPSSTLIASRTEVRLTWNSRASSRSGGSLLPDREAPVENRVAQLLRHLLVNAPPQRRAERNDATRHGDALIQWSNQLSR